MVAACSTSPFASLNTSLTLSPSTNFSSTSDAIHPSVVSGCQARVPTSYRCAMVFGGITERSCPALLVLKGRRFLL